MANENNTSYARRQYDRRNLRIFINITGIVILNVV